jgi:acid stress-induced BolA-like protein IbaG/YrbA
MQDKIEKLINENIPDAVCSFEGDACNLKLTVVSSAFKDLSLVNQHRKILKLLENDFESGELHALSLETRTY